MLQTTDFVSSSSSPPSKMTPASTISQSIDTQLLPPVSRLPPELMAHIFRFLTNKNDKYTTLFVCKYWFAVSVDSFWLRPNLLKEKQVKQVQQVLKRALLGISGPDPTLLNIPKDENNPSSASPSQSTSSLSTLTDNPILDQQPDVQPENPLQNTDDNNTNVTDENNAIQNIDHNSNQNINQITNQNNQITQQDNQHNQNATPNTQPTTQIIQNNVQINQTINDENSDEDVDVSDTAPDSNLSSDIPSEDDDQEDPLALVPLTAPYHLMIRRINLTSVPRYVSDRVLVSFAVCKNLERLTIVGCSQVTDRSLIPIISNCNRILSVDMTGLFRVTDATFLAFAKYCPKLQALYAPGCKELTDTGVSSLARSCTGLKRIKLTACELLTDSSILLLIDNCPSLVELDLSNVPKVTNTVLTQSLLKLPQLREFKMAMNTNINDNAILQLTDPNAVAPEHSDPLPPILGGPQQVPFNLLNPHQIIHVQQTIQVDQPQSASSGSASPAPSLLFDKLRVVDFSNCTLITDISIKKLVAYAPRLRNVTLAKCSNITDRSLASLATLGRNLHYIHLGHCSNITNRGVTTLVKACTRIEYIDVASCNQLTDSAVKDLASLPKLRRVGLVKCQQITDAAIYAFTQRSIAATSNGNYIQTENPLERVHLSYCSNITVGAITHLLNACPKLTHLSLSGVPSFLVDDLRQFCRQPPEDFTQHQQSIFCVFSSNGVKELRNYLNFKQAELRNQTQLSQQHQQLLQMVNQTATMYVLQQNFDNHNDNNDNNNNPDTNNQRAPNQIGRNRQIPGPALFDPITGLLLEIQLDLDEDAIHVPYNVRLFDDDSIQSALQTGDLIRRQVLVNQLMNGVGLPELLQHQHMVLGHATFEIIPTGAVRPRHNILQNLSLSRPTARQQHAYLQRQPLDNELRQLMQQEQIFQDAAAQSVDLFQSVDNIQPAPLPPMNPTRNEGGNNMNANGIDNFRMRFQQGLQRQQQNDAGTAGPTQQGGFEGLGDARQGIQNTNEGADRYREAVQQVVLQNALGGGLAERAGPELAGDGIEAIREPHNQQAFPNARATGNGPNGLNMTDEDGDLEMDN